MEETEYSDSGFIVAGDVTALWQEIMLLQRRQHSALYRGKRYGRWFILKGLTKEQQPLTNFRLLQEREFRLGIQLVHPNIVATYSLEEVPDIGRCIVMESVDGQTFDHWLATKPNRQKRQRVLMQLLDAVEYLHARQLVHHDLKPGNILVTRNGENVKLIDFGLSDTDDSATPAPNDLQDDLLRIANLIDLLHLRGYKPIACACRKRHYKNIAELRKGISHYEKLQKELVYFAGTMTIVVCTIVCTLAYTRHQQAIEEAAFEQKKQAMLSDVNTICDRQEIMLRQVVERETYREFATLQFNKHCRFAALQDSLNALYPNDDAMLNFLCNSEFSKRSKAIQNNILKEANKKPDLNEDYAAGHISKEVYLALLNQLSQLSQEANPYK